MLISSFAIKPQTQGMHSVWNFHEAFRSNFLGGWLLLLLQSVPVCEHKFVFDSYTMNQTICSLRIGH